MAVVETLEIRFQADMGRFSAQLTQLAAQIGGIGMALEGGKGQIFQSAAGLIQTAARALQGRAAESAAPRMAGSMLADKFAGGISDGRNSAALSALRVASAADFLGGGADRAARNAGAALSRGFANGISSGRSTVMQAVNRVVNAAVNRIRSALQIHSPSRVSFEMGGFFAEGFADGIYASIRLAEMSVDALGAASASALPGANAVLGAADTNGIADMMRTAVSDALGGTSIVVPLNVDGMKLGEASIRGINRVTRSAGRLMLEI